MAIVHDPGPDGPSGEGETVVVSICLVTIITFVRLITNYMRRGTESAAGNENEKEIEKKGKEENLPAVEKKPSIDLEVTGKDGQHVVQVSEDQHDKDIDKALEKWTKPEPYDPSPEFRENFIKYASLGLVSGDVYNPEGGSQAFKAFYFLSGVNWLKVGLFMFVWYLIFVFLVCLGLMGNGFKLLGGKDSAKMFDVVDNPISGVMVGVLATVLVQSSSTTTSIIIGLVGADEMSVSTAIPMVMGANIGTSVTNTLVAMGHFANKDELSRGFAGATVHDMFNLLSVAVILPIQWASDFLGHLSYEMAKDADACDEDEEDCDKQEFIKPYISPYYKDVANYDKKVANYVSEGYCDGQCSDSDASDSEKSKVTEYTCKDFDDEDLECNDYIDDYRSSWVKSDMFKSKRLPAYIQFTNGEADYAQAKYYFECPLENGCDDVAEFWNRTSDTMNPAVNTASTDIYNVCHKMKYGLCDKRLLKGGLMLRDWDLSDEAAGALAVFLSITGLCAVIYLIVQTLNVLVKGHAAIFLRKAVSLNGYLSMAIGVFVTMMVQSSSITTSVLTPLVAVGLITLEEMFPLTLGANIGTTLTGIMAATVVTSNPVEAWQVAICHLLFNILGICIWYPVPYMRQFPLNGARYLGGMSEQYVWFPLAYVGVVFFVIPAICYGIAVGATS